jgi:homeobox protein cut-like
MDPENTLGEKLQLEVLLTARMKALESDLSDARQALREAQKHEAAAREEASGMRASLEASGSLVARLEADLETHLQSARGKGDGAARPGVTGSMDLSELLGVDMTTNTSTSKSDLVAITTASPPSASAAQLMTNQNQMVNILQAQRDRYKERLSQAESAMLSVQQRLSHAETSKTQLEQDNLALYAKIRYLQSVGGTGTGASSSSSRGYGTKSMAIRSTSVRPGAGMSINQFAGMLSGGDEERGPRHRGGHDEEERENDDSRGNYEVESRYGALYEQKMNPFAEFSQIEKQRRLQELSVADRIVLNTTMAFVSSHTGRSFLVIYLSLMHLLVFFVIYWNTHHHHHGCDPALDQTISALHRGEAIGAHHTSR